MLTSAQVSSLAPRYKCLVWVWLQSVSQICNEVVGLGIL